MPAPAHALRIARWKDGAASAVSLYYDDGTDSAFDLVVPSLVRRRIPGTFYLCCGWYKGADDPKLARWGALARRHPGIVVLGEHTWGHGGGTSPEGLADAIARNGALLREMSGLPPGALLSFGRPGGCAWTLSREEEAAVLAAHGEVLRHDFGPENSGGPANFHKEVAMHAFADAAAILDRAERDGGWEILLFHGVGGDWIAFPAAEHEKLLAEIDRRRAAGRVWCGAAIAVHKYERERAVARLAPDAAPDGALAAARLSVETDPGLYDEPLTVEAAVPRDRDSVAVEIAPEDGASAASLRAPAVDGLARFDVPPRAARIVLR